MDVTYKLWEGSWEDDAVLRDTERGVYADPEKVHLIHHAGKYYDVIGPHLSEPSPQRTPLLFQAGSSSRGREFAAKHAECVFIGTTLEELRAGTSIVDDVRGRAASLGRHPHDIQFFQGLSPVVAGTEAEAKAKEAEYLDQLSVEADLAHLSGSFGVDLSEVDPDQPLESFPFHSMRGAITGSDCIGARQIRHLPRPPSITVERQLRHRRTRAGRGCSRGLVRGWGRRLQPDLLGHPRHVRGFR